MINIRVFISIISLISVLAFLLLFFTGCSSTSRESLQIQDYSHTGFLSDHVFQLTIKAEADKSIMGLVDRRSSSLVNAEKNLQERITRIIADHLTAELASEKALSPPITEEIRSVFIELTGEYSNLGSRVVEYYDEDETVVLVYQINRKNLKSELESLRLKVFNDYSLKKSGDK